MYSFNSARIALGASVALAVSMAACSDTSAPKSLKNPEQASRAAAVQPAGLVAAYNFNETSGTSATDVSGNNNGGTLGGGVSHVTAGKFGGALQFDGRSMVTIPNAPSLALTGGVTLEAWVNPSAVNSDWRDVVYKGNDNYFLMATSTHSPRPAAGITRAGAESTNETYGTATLPSNTWTHIAMTYDGSTERLFVNGVQVSSTAVSGSLTTSSFPLTIGGDPIYGQYFQGLIDEVRVYGRALSATEIQSDMATAVGAAAADTTPPTLSITGPTNQSTYSTTSNMLTLSGTASDNVGVTSISWANDRGGTGTAGGTTSWSVANIPLQMGVNVMTVTARDPANNATVDTLTVTVSAPTSSASGLVAAYSFSETSGSTILDASVNGNTGSMGANVARSTTGKFGNGLTFSGGMVTIPNSPSIALSSRMTLEAWINPSTVSRNWVDVLMKGRDNFYLMATSDRATTPIAAITFAGNQQSTGTQSPTTLPANTWTHVAATYDGTTLRLYQNGKEVSNIPGSDAITTSTEPLLIGGDPYYGQYFRGQIDEVRVYNRALSATEIANDMVTAISGTATPPQDTQAPSIAVTSPVASGGTYATTSSTVNMNGTSSDNVGVNSVTWTSSTGGSGTATGTTNWSAGAIPLQSGANTITMTARDAAGNASSATITVNYTPAQTPTPTSLAMQTQPSSSATSGTAFAQQPVIQLRDASNSPIAKSGVVVTAAIASGTGTLGGTKTATTNASGVASFSNLSITGSGTYTLSFSATGLTSTASAAISVSSGQTQPPPQGNAPEPGAGDVILVQDNFERTAANIHSGYASRGTITSTDGHGGGTGIRFAYTAGSDDNLIESAFSSSSDIYIRYWFRITAGGDPTCGGSNPSGMKWFMPWRDGSGQRYTMGVGNLGSGSAGLEFTSHDNGSTNEPNPFLQNKTKAIRFGTTNDGQWHKYTVHVVTGSNGYEQIWIDGTLVLDNSGMGYNHDAGGVAMIQFPGAVVNFSGCSNFNIDADDLAVWHK